MVNSEHHASIEMEKLAEYLGGKLETFQHLTRECSIYRVPERKRCLHPSDYTPKMVSIGPFHYGKPELKAMEEQKERYLKCFLQRTKVRQASFLEFVKQREAEVRNCYAETIHNLASDEFVTMVLVDAVFLIELFLRYYNRNLRTDEADYYFSKLRILDLSNNNFTGSLPALFFKNMKAMTDIGEAADENKSKYMGETYYEDSVTLIIKRQEVKLMKILTIFTTIDLSKNSFHGEIPELMGKLHSLRLLNLLKTFYQATSLHHWEI